MLSATGARGAALGRELIDQGGLSEGIYEEAVQTLIAAHRFEKLAPEGLEDESRHRLLDYLSEALADDATIAAQVADALRAMEPPTVKDDGFAAFLDLAAQVHAPDVARAVARSGNAPPESRVAALESLLAMPDEAQAAAALAGDILTDPSAPAERRRRLLDDLHDSLTAQGEAGLAVLRRVADHDASRWIREAASNYLRDAEDH